MNGEYDEAYDDSIESAFGDLEYDESRRRRGRGRGRGRYTPRVTVTPAPTPFQRPENAANRMRDRQLARAINGTADDVSDVETRLSRANADIGRLKNLALVSLILPRTPDITRQRFQVRMANNNAILEATNNPVGAGVIELPTNVGSRLEMMPIVAFMMMSRGIGTGARGATASNDNMMPMVLLLMVMQQQQQQAAAAAAAAAAGAAGGVNPAAVAPPGGLDTMTLLMLMMAMGSF